MLILKQSFPNWGKVDIVSRFSTASIILAQKVFCLLDLTSHDFCGTFDESSTDRKMDPTAADLLSTSFLPRGLVS